MFHLRPVGGGAGVGILAQSVLPSSAPAPGAALKHGGRLVGPAWTFRGSSPSGCWGQRLSHCPSSASRIEISPMETWADGDGPCVADLAWELPAVRGDSHPSRETLTILARSSCVSSPCVWSSVWSWPAHWPCPPPPPTARTPSWPPCSAQSPAPIAHKAAPQASPSVNSVRMKVSPVTYAGPLGRKVDEAPSPSNGRLESSLPAKGHDAPRTVARRIQPRRHAVAVRTAHQGDTPGPRRGLDAPARHQGLPGRAQLRQAPHGPGGARRHE